MKQEDFNAMMRYPWETNARKYKQEYPHCPRCGEKYCGDGVDVCTECKHEEASHV